MMILSSNKYNYGLSYNLNKRSLNHYDVKNFNWNVIDLFIQNKKLKYSIGLNTFKDGHDLIFSSRSNFQLGLIRSKINFERSYKPYHIVYADLLNFEQNDCIWIDSDQYPKKLTPQLIKWWATECDTLLMFRWNRPWVTNSFFMTKKDALKEFRSCGKVVRGDAIWTRENWNDYTDFLCRDGQITMKQYETWTNPF